MVKKPVSISGKDACRLAAILGKFHSSVVQISNSDVLFAIPRFRILEQFIYGTDRRYLLMGTEISEVRAIFMSWAQARKLKINL
jgi:hypothetical protein